MQRRTHEEIGAGQQGGYIIAPTEKTHALADAKLTGKPFELDPQRAIACNPQMNLPGDNERFQQEVKAFVWVEPAEGQGERSPGAQFIGLARWRGLNTSVRNEVRKVIDPFSRPSFSDGIVDNGASVAN